MFSDSLERRLVAAENELRAQKSGSALNYGALAAPEDTPEKSWSGRISNQIGADGMNAHFVARFTRSDGIAQPPLVDFAVDFSLATHVGVDDFKKAGFGVKSYQGPDPHAADETVLTQRLAAIGENFVEWEIIVGGANGAFFFSSGDGTEVSLSVQAISMAPGDLTLRRES